MSAEYIRKTYNVPAKRGMRVSVYGRLGTITAFKDARLRVRFDGEKKSVPAHPTDGVTYQPSESAVARRRRKKFYAALRSGKYEQGQGALATKGYQQNWRYCCLGVACEVARENGLQLKVVDDYNGGYYDRCYNGNYGVLPREVRDWYDFTVTDPYIELPGLRTTATYTNDSLEWDFNAIADAFERTYG